MGRYYNGTISGKFWFAIQSSNDATNFKNKDFIEPDEYYSYYSCGCEVEDINKLYCNNCFSTYDDHINSLDDYDVKCVDNKLIAYMSNHIKYIFEADELEFVQSVLKKLEEEIGKDNISKLHLDISSEEGDFEYDIDMNEIEDNKEDTKDINELIARWCLGKQIEAALTEVGSCIIHCEL
jgi:hypothetical protein